MTTKLPFRVHGHLPRAQRVALRSLPVASLSVATIVSLSTSARTFRQRICTPEKKMKGFLADIHAGSNSPLARQLAGALMDVFHETFSGIYSEAMKSTQWMSITAYADMLSGDSFRTRDLRGGKLSVFVQIPMASLRATPALARVVIGALMNAVYQAEGKISGRVLFLLDEVNFLGRLKVLEDARDAGRKYGITLVPMWQSLGQLADTWGANGKASWFNSASWRLFSALEDDATCAEVSKMCGTYTILKRTEGMSSGSNSGSNSGSSSKARNEACPRDRVSSSVRRRSGSCARTTRSCSGAAPSRFGPAVPFSFAVPTWLLAWRPTASARRPSSSIRNPFK